MAIRIRADRLLVDRGLFESRAQAQAAIMAGLVTADDEPVARPSDQIRLDATLQAERAHPWVSRGGVKLAAALDHFGFDCADQVCLDVGASTGGFTDVLLKRGARRVYAVDVGHGQLHASLSARPDVIALEGTDIRGLSAPQLSVRPTLGVVDVSFISLKLVLPAVERLLSPRARLLALIKPQFEAGRRRAKSGVVRDSTIHAAVCDDIARFVGSLGWNVAGISASPITGGDGNREFFVGAARD
jgi:23S rRNA (cytidine1920-2'-O)/16S rRNA (cytidine1409-2'-O)-methyltransferase